jgi:hypothetical protein
MIILTMRLNNMHAKHSINWFCIDSYYKYYLVAIRNIVGGADVLILDFSLNHI